MMVDWQQLPVRRQVGRDTVISQHNITNCVLLTSIHYTQ
jgi:hypothetical protein